MRVLLTGATGFLGKELHSKLILAGHVVYGLSRHGPLIGDICKYNLDLEESPEVDVVIHSAALLTFSNKQEQQLIQVNTEGTRNVCDFCLTHRIGKLVYISTAYVCGDTQGVWKQSDFNTGQKFKNPYEMSKFWGEAIVRAYANGFGRFHPPINTTIVRSGIIVGDSKEGRATAFEGFYLPVRAIARVMTLVEKKLPRREDVEAALHLPKLRIPIAIRGNPDSTLNLVPVDWVADSIINLINEDRQGTYHLTDPAPMTNNQICEVVSDLLSVTGIHFDPNARMIQPHDRVYNLFIKDFRPYLQSEPRFESTIDPPPTGPEWLQKVVKYWRGENARHVGKEVRLTEDGKSSRFGDRPDGQTARIHTEPAGSPGQG